MPYAVHPVSCKVSRSITHGPRSRNDRYTGHRYRLSRGGNKRREWDISAGFCHHHSPDEMSGSIVSHQGARHVSTAFHTSRHVPSNDQWSVASLTGDRSPCDRSLPLATTHHVVFWACLSLYQIGDQRSTIAKIPSSQVIKKGWILKERILLPDHIKNTNKYKYFAKYHQLI